MEPYLSLSIPGRRDAAYPLGKVKHDVVYKYYRFQDVAMTISQKEGCVIRCSDGAAQHMAQLGLIDPEQLYRLEEKILSHFSNLSAFDDCSAEMLYHHIHQLRRDVLGADVLEQYRARQSKSGASFCTAGGIDQSELKRRLVRRSRSVIFLLLQAAHLPLLRADLEAARSRGKQLFVLCSDQAGSLLPTRQTLSRWLDESTDIRFLTADSRGIAPDTRLQAALASDKACLLAYGEEALLQCRSLTLDAVVSAVPESYHARAVTNQLGCDRGCVVYVPRHLDITRYVPLTSRTRVSYWHLAKLWEDHGDGIYSLTPEDLYRHYPQYFVNVYDDGTYCRSARPDFPIQVDPGGEADVFAAFDQGLDESVRLFLNTFTGVQFHSAYFDPGLNPQPICRDSSQPQPGILVQAIRVARSQGAAVMTCKNGITPRQMFAQKALAGTGLVSNFLFFLTPKLGVLYNDLRADRPLEQADAASGHLDYMLAYQDGKRVETFPLFGKTCIAMKEDGSFLFCNFFLGGGSVDISGVPYCWTSDAVNSLEDLPLRLYTPLCSAADQDSHRDTYRKLVGQGRVNVILLRDRVTCIRRGDVVLPSVGVVLSLTEEAAAPLLAGLTPLEDGYYDVTGLELTVKLDPPQDVPAEEWQRVRWAYGGGLTLMRHGAGLCDGDNMAHWFRREGWMSPLSQQTQESSLHTLVKHPRTAIGITQEGDLVVLVYSGRTWRSTGADYREMIAIARQLFPDISTLMNVDGGGSAMLGLVTEGTFLELSCPSTSAGSCAGMVRPVNTVFYIPITHQEA